jgi:redox-sensitive bicupin YhaK (pirin superfamily)
MNTQVIEKIASRQGVIGEGLVIRRALPSKERRMVGAWCFLDHAGPMQYGPGEGLQVGPHPHIGLQTFTWMIEGQVMHRDSLGYEQVIRPNQVNLMTAGSGIVHAEDAVDNQPGTLHAAQLWIALPDAERHREPAFEHYPELPVITQDDFCVTVLAGECLGKVSPVKLYTPLLGLDLTTTGAAKTSIPLKPEFEHAALVLRGSATIAGEDIAPGTLLYLGSERDQLNLQCNEECQILLLGGEPFKEEPLVWWNFVARTQAEIEQATLQWNEGSHFGEVKGSPSPKLKAPSLDGLSLKGGA